MKFKNGKLGNEKEKTIKKKDLYMIHMIRYIYDFAIRNNKIF